MSALSRNVRVVHTCGIADNADIFGRFYKSARVVRNVRCGQFYEWFPLNVEFQNPVVLPNVMMPTKSIGFLSIFLLIMQTKSIGLPSCTMAWSATVENPIVVDYTTDTVCTTFANHTSANSPGGDAITIPAMFLIKLLEKKPLDTSSLVSWTSIHI
jgi:hypothetical protein